MPRQPNTTVDGKRFSKKTKNDVWEKGREIPGMDPSVYREDLCGAVMKRDKYGETKQFGLGWEIDHEKSVKDGGSDVLRNLQPMQWQNNREKSDKKTGDWDCKVSRDNQRFPKNKKKDK